jgi:hypothetical protein
LGEAVTVTIPIALSRDNLLTSNQRLNHFDKARRTRAIRDMALVWARHLHPAKMQAATLNVEVSWPPLKRTRDAHNLQPAAKAAIDGVVGDYGLLPGDDDRYLKAVTFTAADEACTLPGIACFIKLTFTEVNL